VRLLLSVVAGWSEASQGDLRRLSEGRQHAGERMYEKLCAYRGARNPARVLTGCAAETKQRELGRIEPLAGRYLADGVCHRLDCDIEE